MKEFLSVIFTVCLVACASSNTTQTPRYAEPLPLPRKEEVKEDNFDKLGEITASSSRWVWNHATQAWEWVTSEENKERASKAWQSTKEAVISGYHRVQKAYQNSFAK